MCGLRSQRQTEQSPWNWAADLEWEKPNNSDISDSAIGLNSAAMRSLAAGGVGGGVQSRLELRFVWARGGRARASYPALLSSSGDLDDTWELLQKALCLIRGNVALSPQKRLQLEAVTLNNLACFFMKCAGLKA